MRGDARAAFLIGLAVETGVGVQPDPRRALEFYRKCPDGDADAARALARVGLLVRGAVDLGEIARQLELQALAHDAQPKSAYARRPKSAFISSYSSSPTSGSSKTEGVACHSGMPPRPIAPQSSQCRGKRGPTG